MPDTITCRKTTYRVLVDDSNFLKNDTPLICSAQPFLS
jgi:hypothetical protein